MKKISYIGTIFVLIFCFGIATVFAGSFKEIADKNFSKGITSQIQVLSFEEDGRTFDFGALQSKNTTTFSVVMNRKDMLYTRKLPYANYCRIRQIYNEEAKLYFYLVSAAYYIGESVDYSYIMGYDPRDGKWWIYADYKDFKNPLSKNAMPWFSVNKNGDLLMTFMEDDIRRRTPSQQYTMYWDDDKRNFIYTDDGVKIRK